MRKTITLLCDDCGLEFLQRGYEDGEPLPDCPSCVRASATQIPGMFNIGTTKSKAIDFTQKMVERDYGLTDFADNQRAGDVAYKPESPMHTAESDALIRDMIAVGAAPVMPDHLQKAAQDFWSPKPLAAMAPANAGQLMQAAGGAAALARSEGIDPVQLLHEAGRKGDMDMKLRVVGRSDGKS